MAYLYLCVYVVIITIFQSNFQFTNHFYISSVSCDLYGNPVRNILKVKIIGNRNSTNCGGLRNVTDLNICQNTHVNPSMTLNPMFALPLHFTSEKMTINHYHLTKMKRTHFWLDNTIRTNGGVVTLWEEEVA